MTDRPDIPLEEVVRAGIDGALLYLHTALPGIVKAYYPKTGTCDVQPAVKRAIEREDGSFAFESLPVISNVRVCWPGGQGFELRFPLYPARVVGEVTIPGDTVLLVFAEVDTSKFESSGHESNPAWLERHGLQSPVAYPYGRVHPPSNADPEVQQLPQLVAPEPFHVGDPLAAQFVALSNKVDAALATIQAKFDAHTHVVATTGTATAQSGTAAAVIPAQVIGSLDSTAAVKLKAE